MAHMSRHRWHTNDIFVIVIGSINWKILARISFGISMVIDECPMLRSLTLYYGVHFGNVLLSKIAKLKDLMHLDLHYCVDQVTSIVEGCCHLQKLDLGQCKQLTDDYLLQIAKNLPNLRSLTINKCPQVTDLGITNIAVKCPLLRELDISHCFHVSEIAIDQISQSCLQLRRIDVRFCGGLSDLGILRLKHGCRMAEVII